MNKEKEIEGMTQAILGEARCKGSCADCYLLTARKSNGEPYAICYPRKEAIRLYEAGYRKADEVRGETANEILTYIGNMADECDDRFKLKNYHWFVKLCQKYGVIIDNNATH